MNRTRRTRSTDTVCHYCRQPVNGTYHRQPIKDIPGAHWRICHDCHQEQTKQRHPSSSA